MTRGGPALGVPALLRQLFDDVRDVARAEVRLVKARIFDLVRKSRAAIGLLMGALLAVQGAVTALMVGLVLQLAPLVGAALAGAIVMLVVLLLAGMLVWAATRLFAKTASPPVANTVEAGT